MPKDWIIWPETSYYDFGFIDFGVTRKGNKLGHISCLIWHRSTEPIKIRVPQFDEEIVRSPLIIIMLFLMGLIASFSVSSITGNTQARSEVSDAMTTPAS